MKPFCDQIRSSQIELKRYGIKFNLELIGHRADLPERYWRKTWVEGKSYGEGESRRKRRGRKRWEDNMKKYWLTCAFSILTSCPPLKDLIYGSLVVRLMHLFFRSRSRWQICKKIRYFRWNDCHYGLWKSVCLFICGNVFFFFFFGLVRQIEKCGREWGRRREIVDGRIWMGGVGLGYTDVEDRGFINFGVEIDLDYMNDCHIFLSLSLLC